MWSGEDTPADVLVPRLIAAGADPARVHLVSGFTSERGARAFDPATDIAALAVRLARMDPPPALLIVDPLVSAVTGDSHKNAEVRSALQPLVDLAAAHGVAVLGVSHFSKGTQGRDPTERVTGSLAFGALARVVMATARIAGELGGGCILVRAKSNLGPDAGGFGYHLDLAALAEYPGISATRVIWGEVLEGSARELLSRADTRADPDTTGEASDVEVFIRSCLADGPVSAKQMQEDASGAGYSWDRVKRTAHRLGVERCKDGYQGSWVWTLPVERNAKGDTEPAKECKGITLRSTLAILGDLDHHASRDRQYMDLTALAEYPGISATRVIWGEVLEGSARELLSRADTRADPDTTGEASDVEVFIRSCLADGPVSAKQMQEDASGAGYSWNRVKRTAYRIGIERRKEGFNAGWVWALRREHNCEESAEGSEGITLRRVHSSHSSGDSAPSTDEPPRFPAPTQTPDEAAAADSGRRPSAP